MSLGDDYTLMAAPGRPGRKGDTMNMSLNHAMLDDDEVEDVRFQAIEALRTLEPEVLTRYAQDIIPGLDDDVEDVRYEAIKALGRLLPEVLTRYAQDIIPRLDDDEEWVRSRAIEALGKLEPQMLARYAHKIIPRLGDNDALPLACPLPCSRVAL